MTDRGAQGGSLARVLVCPGGFEGHHVGDMRAAFLAGAEEHRASGQQVVLSRGPETAPAPFPGHGRTAVGKGALVDDRYLGLIILGSRIPVPVQQVAGILGVAGPGAPGDPDPMPSLQAGFPAEDISALAGLPFPVTVTHAEIGEPGDIHRIFRLPTILSGTIGDGLSVGRLLDLRDPGGCLSGWVGPVIEQENGLPAGQRLEGGQRGFDRGQLSAQLGDFLLRFGGRGRAQGTLAVFHPLEEGHHGIVVMCWNGIELVVVTAGAVHRQSQKGRGGRAHHIVQFIGPLVGGEHRVAAFHRIHRSPDQESGGGVFAQSIAGYLLADEPVERSVFIEGADHIIPVRPRILAGVVLLKAVAFRKTDHIQPMPRPPLAETGRSQQMIDECRGIRMAGVGGDFLGSRREPQQVERNPADESARIRWRGQGEAFRPQGPGNEMIDGIFGWISGPGTG